MNKFLIIAFVSSLLLFSCKKQNKDSVLGLDVQPDSDLLGVTISDTSTIHMHTISNDSVRVYNDQYKLLGSNQDPIFGRCDASIYTNISLPNNITGVSFGVSPNVDYAEIRLKFTGQFSGDTSTLQSFNVYSLEQKIPTDTLYYTKSNFAKNNTPICSVNTKLKIAEDGYLYLVLPISTFYADYIIQNPVYLTDNTTFINTYKGLYITASNSNLNPVSQQGSIMRFDLDDAASGLFIHYHNGTSPTNKPQVFQITFTGSDAIRYTHIHSDHNAGGAINLISQLNGDTTKGSQDIYLQGFGITKAKLYLPYLKNFSDSQHVAISRAELTLKVDDTPYPLSANYGFPPTIALLAVNSDGKEEYVKDQYSNSIIQYGGSYDATNKQYVFNIARQVQDIVDGKIANYGFYLVQANVDPNYVTKRDDRLERVIIGGAKNNAYKPVFKVTYIKYPYDKH